MSGGLSTSASPPPESWDVPLTTNKGGSHASAVATHPARWEVEENCLVLPQLEKECMVFTSIMTKPQQVVDVTQLYVDNINQIRNHFP
jgi:hypothetical protein